MVFSYPYSLNLTTCNLYGHHLLSVMTLPPLPVRQGRGAHLK